MAAWIEPEPVEVPDDYIKVVGGHPVVAHILYRRGIKIPQEALSFLNLDLYKASPSSEIPGLEKAVSRLIKALEKGETVCVWGDFDVDGQTSTALLISALRNINIDAVYHVPLRDIESHGVNIPYLEKIIGGHSQPEINLLLTCDTGIDSHEAIKLSNQCGVDVIITDHHDLPEMLPDAEAILNPKMLAEDHPLRNLPGVGVAYKLIEGLYNRIGFKDKTDQFLDLVALGIVSDVVMVTKDNRYLLQSGIKKLRQAERPGLRALYELIELDPNLISEEHLGFMIGPRLNAVGRLDDAAKGVELLLTDNTAKARILALELETFNSRRKLLTNQVYQAALSGIEKNPGLVENKVIIISNPTWPPGIIGIVASKLVEKYNKPVILISTADDHAGKGSARSVEGVDISAAIRDSSRFLLEYGGHPMAAGLKIDPAKIEDFTKSISDYVAALDIPDVKEAVFDGTVDLGEISKGFIEDVERLGPFGPGNRQLIFMSEDLKFQDYTTVGREDEHISLTVYDREESKYRLIWWNGADEFDKKVLENSRFNLLYTARSSSFRGSKSVQLEWVDFQVIEKKITYLEPSRIWKIRDFRKIHSKLEKLIQLEIGEETQIWIEAGGDSELRRTGIHRKIEAALVDRYNIKPAVRLVIWTTPPGRWELRHVIERSSPTEIIFFCVNPNSLDFHSFVIQLMGMVKFGINSNNGILDVQKMAGHLGQREITIRKGLDWIISRGYIMPRIEGTFEIAARSEYLKTDESELLQNQIELLIEETNAYRNYLKDIDIEILNSGI